MNKLTTKQIIYQELDRQARTLAEAHGALYSNDGLRTVELIGKTRSWRISVLPIEGYALSLSLSPSGSEGKIKSHRDLLFDSSTIVASLSSNPSDSQIAVAVKAAISKISL